MAETSVLVAATRIGLRDPQLMLHKLCEHFVEHGIVTLHDGCGRIDSPFGITTIAVDAGELIVTAECPNEIALSVIKAAVAEHIFEFSVNEQPRFSWTGDRAAEHEIPYFREMVVVASRSLTPRMRRVTLAGADLSHFERGGPHVRVLIPPIGREPRWPRASEDGRIVWPKGDDTLASRVYTIRRIDHTGGSIDIDVVLHGDNHTPGAAWAVRAAAGERVGLMGPGGGFPPEVAHYVLAGDETALPVIARILSGLSADKRATVLLEVADVAEEQPLASRAAVDLRWLHRGSEEPGTAAALVDAVRGLDWAGAGSDVYLLVGCEHAAARAIRSFARRELALAKSRHLVAGYWRRGYQDAYVHDGD
jgi:NADPH-dependent ferric siderophore reductase